LLVLDVWMQGGGMDGQIAGGHGQGLDPDTAVDHDLGSRQHQYRPAPSSAAPTSFSKPFKSDRLLLVVKRARWSGRPQARTG
jgi:two-component system nitrogen regulation response regulator NtrX